MNPNPGPSGRRSSTRAFSALLLPLAAFNAWWFYRDARPIPDLEWIDRLVARGRYDDSDRLLREYLRRSPRDGKARMLLARSLASRGQILACAEQLHLVPFWWASKHEALYLEGESFLTIDRARDAEAAWRACAVDDPLHPAPLVHRWAAVEGLVKLYAAQERWAEANEAAWRLHDAAGTADRPRALILRLRTEVERIAPETRAARLRRYVEADPGDWHSRCGLAHAEQELGHEAECTAIMRVCLGERPDDPEVWATWLEILERRGDLAGLAAALERLPAKVTEDGRVWSSRGRVLRSRGDVEGAARAYRRAAALRPNDEQVLYRLGLVERLNGRAGRAEELLARSRAMGEARGQLLPALREFGRSARSGPGTVEFRETTERLAGLCQSLSLGREASALRALIPPS